MIIEPETEEHILYLVDADESEDCICSEMCEHSYISVCAGAAEADRCRAPRLLPAAGVHPAVQVLHSSVPPPPPAQPGASAAQPQGGEEVRITTTSVLKRLNETFSERLSLTK